MVALREGWVAVEGVVTEGEAGAGPPETAPLELLPISPLSWPRRIYLVLITALLLALLVWVRTPAGQLGGGPGSEFSDHSAMAYPADTAEAPRWEERVPLSVARARLALAFYEGWLYAIGGETANGVTGQVARYDLQSNMWEILAEKATPAANIGAAVLRGRIYVPGGYTDDGELTDVLEIYDPQADQWSSAASLPEPRCAYGLTAFEGQLYLFGGWDGHSYVDTVYRYDPQADAWSTGAPLRTPRGFLGAATVGGHIYVVGGYDGVREYSLCEAYDPQEGWSLCAPMKMARGGLGVAAVGGRLYAIGGGMAGGWALVCNEWYNPREDVWNPFETPIVGQWSNPGVAADGTSISAVGGWSGEYLAQNYEYQALWQLFLPVAP